MITPRKEITMTAQGFTIATADDVRKLTQIRKEKDRYSSYERVYRINHAVELADTPFGENKDHFLGDKLGIPNTYKVRAAVVAPNEYHHYYEYSYDTNYQYKLKKGQGEKLKQLPMFILVSYDGHNNRGAAIKTTAKLEALAATAKNPIYLGETGSYSGYYYYHDASLGASNILVEVEVDGTKMVLACPFNVAERVFGLEVTEDMKLRLSNGDECDFTGYKDVMDNLNVYRGYRGDRINTFDFTYPTLAAVESRIGMGRKNLGKLLKGLLKSGWKIEEPGKLSGIKKMWQRLEPVMKEVMEENPLAFVSYRSFAQECNKSIDGVKISAVFNDVFKDVETKEDFLKALKEFYTGKESGDLYNAQNKLEESVKKLDVYKEKRKAVLKSQANRAFAKIQQEAENLTIDKKKHKLTWARSRRAIWPIGVFFRKSEQYFLLNDNWDLWEEMFKRGYGEQAIELANEVKGRTTYEKDS
jgi:hypothetical protein